MKRDRRDPWARRIFGTGMAAAVSCIVLGWGGLAHAQCMADTECKGDRVCNAGACVDAPQRTPEPAATSSSPPESDKAVPMRPRSIRMKNAGIALTAVGAASLVATTVLWSVWIAEELKYQPCDSTYLSTNTTFTNRTAGVSCTPGSEPTNLLWTASIMTLVTPVLLGTGIPLWAVGAHQVPVRAEDHEAAPLRLRSVAVGLGRTVMTFEF